MVNVFSFLTQIHLSILTKIVWVMDVDMVQPIRCVKLSMVILLGQQQTILNHRSVKNIIDNIRFSSICQVYYLQIVEKATELDETSWILRKHNGACRVVTAGGTDSATICEDKQFEEKPKKPVCEFGKHIKKEKTYFKSIIM